MSATARCPRCGTELQNPGSPQEVCPECFLKLGLSGAIAAPPPEAEAESQEEAPTAEKRETPRADPEVLAEQPARHYRNFPWRRAAEISALILGVFAIVVLVRVAFRPAPVLNEMRLTIPTPETTDPFSFAVSPDGSQVVFAAVSEGSSQLWLRRMDSIEPRPLHGTEDGFYPFWSPDSAWIGFFANGKLKRVPVNGGPPQTLASAPLGCGGTWNADRMILFAPSCNGPLLRVSDNGGDPQAVLLNNEYPGLRFPQFLPDGRRFLFFAAREQNAGVAVGDLSSSETIWLLDTDTAAVYSPSGYLLFAREGTLLAVPFDARRLELSDSAYPAVGQVAVDTANSAMAVSASANGTIVYRSGPSSATGRLVWFDQSGRATEMLDPETAAEWPAISPDGRSVAVQRTINGNTDIWLFDAGRPSLRRLTFDPSVDTSPLWSPDGTKIVFRSSRSGSSALFQKPASGVGQEELLPVEFRDGVPTGWSADGQFLLYQNVNADTGWDVWTLRMDGDHKSIPVLHANFDELGAQFSPDGHWIAYQSNESGRFEIYLQSFPDPTQKLQVTTMGGTQPVWQGDGRELFFLSLKGMLMAVPIQVNNTTNAVLFGQAQELFFTQPGAGTQRNFSRQYAVSPDGRRFLMDLPTEEAASPLTVILNWQARP